MGVIVIVVDAVEGGARTALRFIGRVGAVEVLDEPDEIGEGLLGETGGAAFAAGCSSPPSPRPDALM